MASPRTDVHRPSVIVHADYNYSFSFNFATTNEGAPVPAINMDKVRQLFEERKLRDLSGCHICGTSFVYGDVWYHRPTGEFILVGHTCADKYSLVADRSEYQALRGHAVQEAIAAMRRHANWARMRMQLRATPDLGQLLRQNQATVRDIRARFIQYGELSQAQVQLLRTISERAAKALPPAPAPEGRFAIEGAVLSTRVEEGPYGRITKMLVQVTTPQGTAWRAWGTAPMSLLEWAYSHQADLKGQRVEFTAKFVRSQRDQAFAFFSRPSSAQVLEATA